MQGSYWEPWTVKNQDKSRSGYTVAQTNLSLCRTHLSGGTCSCCPNVFYYILLLFRYLRRPVKRHTQLRQNIFAPHVISSLFSKERNYSSWSYLISLRTGSKLPYIIWDAPCEHMSSGKNPDCKDLDPRSQTRAFTVH